MSQPGISWRKGHRAYKKSSVLHQAGPCPSPAVVAGWDGVSPLPSQNITYGKHQRQQWAWKGECQQEILRRFAEVAKAEIGERYAAQDEALETKWSATLAVLLDSSKNERDLAWHEKEIARVVETREFRWEARCDSRSGATTYSPRKIVRQWTDLKTKKKTTTGARYHQCAFGAGPWYSLGLFFACERGFAKCARAFMVRFNQAFVDFFYLATNGAYLIDVALHPKCANIHADAHWSQWSDPVPAPDGNGKSIPCACLPQGGADTKNKKFANASLPLMGIVRQAGLGLDVEKLTGREGALAGARDFIRGAGRRQRPLNVLVCRWIDLWLWREVKKPQWRALSVYFQRGRTEYLRRKQEQMELIAELTTAAFLRRRVTELAWQQSPIQERLVAAKLGWEQCERRLAEEKTATREMQGRLAVQAEALEEASKRHEESIKTYYEQLGQIDSLTSECITAEKRAVTAEARLEQTERVIQCHERARQLVPRLSEIHRGMQQLEQGAYGAEIKDLLAITEGAACGIFALSEDVRTSIRMIADIGHDGARKILAIDDTLRLPNPSREELLVAMEAVRRAAERKSTEGDHGKLTEELEHRMKIFVGQRKLKVCDGREDLREMAENFLEALKRLRRPTLLHPFLGSQRGKSILLSVRRNPEKDEAKISRT